jgi:hypothetical protein
MRWKTYGATRLGWRLGSGPAAAGSLRPNGANYLALNRNQQTSLPQRAVAISTHGWRLRVEARHTSRFETMIDSGYNLRPQWTVAATGDGSSAGSGDRGPEQKKRKL